MHKKDKEKKFFCTKVTNFQKFFHKMEKPVDKNV